MKRIFVLLSLCVVSMTQFAQTASDFVDAANRGNAIAQYALGVCYDHGNGVSKNSSMAVYWYRKAAEQGYANAQYNLGYCYERGEGVPQDMSLARYWIKEAAKKGDQYAIDFCRKRGW